MLKPPDSANRPPIGTQSHLTPGSTAGAEPGANTGLAEVAGKRAGEDALAGPDGREHDAATRTNDGDGAVFGGEHDPATRRGEGAARRQHAESWAVERDGANGGQLGTRLVEGQPASSWSHDWLRLSHELRTPLNAILGNIELLLDGSAGPLAAPARACIGDIQVASRQLLHQMQPLLLLVQARTSGALTTRMPLDLMALIRQASADATCELDPGSSQRSDARYDRVACLPEGESSPEPANLTGSASLMVPGDPIWLGALAAALVDLHAGAPGARGPLTITLEPPEPGASGVILRAFWAGLDPTATSPMPLALIDAVLALHGGRIRGFCVDGLRLDLPIAITAPDGSDRGSR